MSSPSAPRTRAGFHIAIICALVEEADAVHNVFDKFWSDDGKRYGRVLGDPNAYTPGVIGRHNVVLVHLGEMGNVAASVAAASLKSSFPGIKLALVVGICGVVPSYQEGHTKLQIWLGDIIISTAVVHYDFGRQYPGRFVRKSALEDNLARASREIRPLLSQLRTHIYRNKISRDIAMYLESIQATEQNARYPGSTLDKLYRASYLHKHHEVNTKCKNCKEEDDPCPQSCDDLKCDDVVRQRNMSCEHCVKDEVVGILASQACVEASIGNCNNSTVVYPQVTLQDLHLPKLSHSHHPSIHFGRFGSANKVMKSGEDRDALAQAEDIIALEMEAVGVWELFPTVVIKSACDYADSHKNKNWQRYATTTAAACMRSVLDEWDGSDLCESEDINRADCRPSHCLGQISFEPRSSKMLLGNEIDGAYSGKAAESDLDREPYVLDKIFAEAIDRFFDSISSEEQALFSQCASPASLLSEIGKLDVIANDKRRRGRVFDRIKMFSDNLHPYFEVITITMQVHPKWAAIAWGAFRLILQLVSKFAGFFEKLSRMIERIAVAFPQYIRLSKITHTDLSWPLKTSLSNTYVDIFEFFISVARVFTKKNGSARNFPLVLADHLRKPFDLRFRNILDRLLFHEQVLRDEIQILQLPKATDNYDGKAKQRQRAYTYEKVRANYHILLENMKTPLTESETDQRLDHMKLWLDIPEFVQEFEDAQGQRTEGTAQWIFRDSKFSRWKIFQVVGATDPYAARNAISETHQHFHSVAYDSVDQAQPIDQRRAWLGEGAKNTLKEANTYLQIHERDFGERVLWIKGNPGCGKTTLAASVIEELKESHPIAPGVSPIVCYFFFGQKLMKEVPRSHAYRALLAQLVQQCRDKADLINKFAFVMDRGIYGQTKPTKQELLELLTMSLGSLPNAWIVLDGIDECIASEDLVPEVLETLRNCPSKLLLFSRPNVESLRTKILERQTVIMSRSSVRDDLQMFFSRSINQLLEKSYLSVDAHVHDIVSRLVKGADGMFLWAKLMIVYLQSPALTPAMRISTIESVRSPEGLHHMYDRILKLIGESNGAQQILARRVFLWLAYSKVPMTAQRFHSVLTSFQLGKSHRYSDLEHTIVVTCGGLAEMTTDSTSRSDRFFRFIHSSVRDYFSSPSTEHDMYISSARIDRSILRRFTFSKAEAESEITTTCLRSLIFYSPAQPLSGSMFRAASHLHLDETFPFLSYAAEYWLYHLQDTIMCFQPLTLLNDRPPWSLLQGLVGLVSQFLSLKYVLMAWIEALYVMKLGREHIYKRLRNWSTSSIDPQDPALRAQLREMSERLVNFGTDLIHISSLWEDTLCSSPHQIWNDITGFTPSVFLAQTVSTVVDSLVPQAIDQHDLCAAPLSTISCLDLNGFELGVLSIWPSRAFKAIWDELGPCGSYLALANVCSGWVARYEVWNVVERPCRFLDLHIPLEQHEVWLQVRHSLCKNQDTIPCYPWKKLANSIHSSRGWRLQFPTSICAKIELFSILRTVYSVDRSTGQHAKHHAQNWSSANLSMTFNDELAVVWSERRRGFGVDENSQSLRLRRFDAVTRACYVYDVQFSDDGRYLLFRDALNLHKEGFSSSFSIAVFKVEYLVDTAELNICLLQTSKDRVPFEYYVSAFHPSEPKLAICTGNDIILWEFSSNESPQSFPIICTVTEHVECLNFSHCGTRLFVKTRSKSKTSAHHVPSKAQAIVSSSSMVVDEKARSLRVTSTMKERIFGALPVLRSGHFHDTQSQSRGAVISVSQETSQREVGVRSWQGDREKFQPILSLPRWPGINEAKIDVVTEPSKKDKIKIVLNKVAQRSYHLSEGVDERLPAVVEKDLRYLYRSSKPEVINSEAESACKDVMKLDFTNATLNVPTYRALVGLDETSHNGLDDKVDRILGSDLEVLTPPTIGYERLKERASLSFQEDGLSSYFEVRIPPPKDYMYESEPGAPADL